VPMPNGNRRLLHSSTLGIGESSSLRLHTGHVYGAHLTSPSHLHGTIANKLLLLMLMHVADNYFVLNLPTIPRH
jgi:hypothetical protein